MVHSFGPTSAVSYLRIGTSGLVPVLAARIAEGEPKAWMVPASSDSRLTLGVGHFAVHPGTRIQGALALLQETLELLIGAPRRGGAEILEAAGLARSGQDATNGFGGELSTRVSINIVT